MKDIMTRAWEIKRENKDNIFGLCLKMAWEESRKVEFVNGMQIEATVGTVTYTTPTII